MLLIILQPDADLSNQPTDVTIIADAVWFYRLLFSVVYVFKK